MLKWRVGGVDVLVIGADFASPTAGHVVRDGGARRLALVELEKPREIRRRLHAERLLAGPGHRPGHVDPDPPPSMI